MSAITTPKLKKYTTSPATATYGTTGTIPLTTHKISNIIDIKLWFRCKVNDNNYTVGMRTQCSFGATVGLASSLTGVLFALSSGGAQLLNRTTGSAFTHSPSNWDYIIEIVGYE